MPPEEYRKATLSAPIPTLALRHSSVLPNADQTAALSGTDANQLCAPGGDQIAPRPPICSADFVGDRPVKAARNDRAATTSATSANAPPTAHETPGQRPLNAKPASRSAAAAPRAATPRAAQSNRCLDSSNALMVGRFDSDLATISRDQEADACDG